jgi:ArsR family transcriptional regulator
MATGMATAASNRIDGGPEISPELEAELVQLFKLLSSTPRLQILMHLLREGELNVSDLCQRMRQTQPAVSHHLALLRVNKLIRLRREGKHSYYSVRSSHVQTVLEQFLHALLGPCGAELRLNDFVVSRAQA